MSEEMMVRYVKFVPDNLQEEIDFIGVLYESGVIEHDNFIRMQGMLELAGYIPCDNPEEVDTGNNFLFRVYGYNTIIKFQEIMRTKMPNCKYKMSSKPFKKLIDNTINKDEESKEYGKEN